MDEDHYHVAGRYEDNCPVCVTCRSNSDRSECLDRPGSFHGTDE